jgi:DNA-binding MarR family transcriptional regulator
MRRRLLEVASKTADAWLLLRASTPAETAATSASRARLLSLLRGDGPLTVPAIARARGVSRQAVQAAVARLVEEGQVELQPNPSHRRSPRVALTNVGRAAVDDARAREEALLESLHVGVSDESLATALRTLEALRLALQHEMARREER